CAWQRGRAGWRRVPWCDAGDARWDDSHRWLGRPRGRDADEGRTHRCWRAGERFYGPPNEGRYDYPSQRRGDSHRRMDEPWHDCVDETAHDDADVRVYERPRSHIPGRQRREGEGVWHRLAV